MDEAQDIERPIWTPLYKLLRDRQNGRFLVFYAPAQRLDEGEWTPIIPNRYRELVLADNVRNTKAIFSVAHQFYTGLEVPICEGPDGRPVECRDPVVLAPTALDSAERDRSALERMLDRLIDGEGISPDDILIVTCRGQKSSAVYPRRTLGKHQLTSRLHAPDKRSIPIVTVRSAKGLEANVVIPAELEGIDGVSARSNHLYVASSRAKHRVYVLSAKDAFLPEQPALAASLLQPNVLP